MRYLMKMFPMSYKIIRVLSQMTPFYGISLRSRLLLVLFDGGHYSSNIYSACFTRSIARNNPWYDLLRKLFTTSRYLNLTRNVWPCQTWHTFWMSWRTHPCGTDSPEKKKLVKCWIQVFFYFSYTGCFTKAKKPSLPY